MIKKTNEILGLHEFFNDESNSENTLKIIEEIKNRKAEFINNPQEFCEKIIPSTLAPTEQKNKFQPEAPLFVTSQDLCYKAIDEMQKGLIAMMEKEETPDSDDKRKATLETVSLIEKFAESNNPILTKDTKNYTPLEAAKEKIGEAKKELSKVNEELSKKSKELKEASEKNSTDKLVKAKAALKLERINPILETQGEKEEYKKGGKHEYNEQEILEYSAKGILSKALRVAAIEARAQTHEGKKENFILETIAEPNLYQRYARKNFIGGENDKIKFENKKFEGNSFANCTFENCDFSATDNKTMHFVNCTFGKGCVLPQKLKNQKDNFSGCKFSTEIFDRITGEGEKEALKKNLGISFSEELLAFFIKQQNQTLP